MNQILRNADLYGDYISDALAACVGGIGMAPGGNIHYQTGAAVFEATHGKDGIVDGTQTAWCFGDKQPR